MKEARIQKLKVTNDDIQEKLKTPNGLTTKLSREENGVHELYGGMKEYEDERIEIEERNK